MSKYPLASSSWGAEEVESISAVIASGMFSMGSNVRQFESEFAGYFGSKHAVMVNSGSSANLLMVAALFFTKNKKNRLQRGDEVIVPAVSWSTTYAPLQQYGLKVKFVDIDSDTLNFDLPKLKTAINDKTRMIFAVNLLGNPNDFRLIQDLIENTDIVLIEDNCESMGAVYEGRKTGSIGLMGSFSTFFSHHMSTMEGGLVTTDDDELFHILLCLRSHGWTRHLPAENLVTGKKSENSFEESFKFVLPGYNLRPLEFSGAIGIRQLAKLPEFLSVRRKNAHHFLEILGNYPEIRTQKEIGLSSWFGFSMILRDGTDMSRDKFVDYLEVGGIEHRPIVSGNFLKNPVIEWFDYEVCGTVPNAENLDDHGLFIGNHQYELDAELDVLAEVLRKCFGH